MLSRVCGRERVMLMGRPRPGGRQAGGGTRAGARRDAGRGVTAAALQAEVGLGGVGLDPIREAGEHKTLYCM